MHVLAHWLTYVPAVFESTDGTFGPGHLWQRLAVERHSMHKVIVSRALLQQPQAFITDGNHLVSEPEASHTGTWPVGTLLAMVNEAVATISPPAGDTVVARALPLN